MAHTVARERGLVTGLAFEADGARLFDPQGHRKYLCGSERRRFFDAAAELDSEGFAFCWLLACTGCRISEALGLGAGGLDPETGRVIFRTLKRRRRVFRAVPVPMALMAALLAIAAVRASAAPLWPWTRQTAWRRVKAV
eukprot:gene19341-19228_t